MSRSRNSHENQIAGFTLIELMVVVAILEILAAISGSKYLEYVEKARVARSIAEMRGIARTIDALLADGGNVPDSLAELGVDGLLDPWDSAYYYLRIEGQLPLGISQTRTPLPLVSASPPDHPSGDGASSNPGTGDGGGGSIAIASARKDRFMVPINSDYDLYSAGRDGATQPTLQTPVSRDDVIRGGDGSYYGLAERF